MNGYWTVEEVRRALLTGQEIAIIDLRSEAEFAVSHPLFATPFPLEGLESDVSARIPRKATPIAVYGPAEDICKGAAGRLRAAGFGFARPMQGGLEAWAAAGFELFADVNSPSKAFGELVESRRHTPSVSAPELRRMIDEKANIVILDARRPDEFATMAIPGGNSMPGAELVLRAQAAAPDPDTTVIVNCAGRTRSIIGAQSLLNAGLPNPVRALRNGTIGWVLDGFELESGRVARQLDVGAATSLDAAKKARAVAYRAGVRRLDEAGVAALLADDNRTLYRFDVRTADEHAAGHPSGFIGVPGGQLVQETDHYAPVRGARIVLFDNLGVRADMSASWLAQMGWEVFTVVAAGPMQQGRELPPARPTEGRYRRPYEGTDNPASAMQAYLDWEYGLVAQLESDGTHGFYVI